MTSVLVGDVKRKRQRLRGIKGAAQAQETQRRFCAYDARLKFWAHVLYGEGLLPAVIRPLPNDHIAYSNDYAAPIYSCGRAATAITIHISVCTHRTYVKYLLKPTVAFSGS